MADITGLLVSAQNPDPNIRKQAEDAIRGFQASDPGGFFFQFASELAKEDKPAEVRTLAGLLLKNALDAKDEARKNELWETWKALDPQLKLQIKSLLLGTLHSPVKQASHTSAQVVAKVATIELPLALWPELVPTLLQNMNVPLARQSTLEALGYSCEELNAVGLEQGVVDSILTAVVQGMRKEEPDNDVRLAATTALLNALTFAQANFQKDAERNYVMQVTCEATQCADMRVRRTAFECLVRIHSEYYEHMQQYIQDVFNLTVKAAREDAEEVALQAIELWSTLCEYEMPEDIDGEPSEDSKNYVKQALPGLVPMLLDSLLKQEEGQEADEGTWNLSMAGGTCLGLVANTVGDQVIGLVLPFVHQAANMEDWRYREAALMAFGSILDGPRPENLQPLVTESMVLLLERLKDPNENPYVKDTAAWTIARVCEFVPRVITPTNLNDILLHFFQALEQAAPTVAIKICWAISFLATESDGNLLTPFFQQIVQRLLTAAERPDVEHTNLRSAAYNALSEVVHCTNDDTIPICIQLMLPMIQKLQLTLSLPTTSNEERQKQADMQALFCGVLQVLIQKLETSKDFCRQMITTYADQLMTLFLQVLACNANSVQEDAMQAIAALVQAMGAEFQKYMEAFYPFLDKGLKNFQEYQVCNVAVGTVGDLCRALGAQLPPAMWDQIVLALLHNVSSPTLHRSVKPAILSCFGDIALALQGGFEKYLAHVMTMLQHASDASKELDGDELTQDEEEMEHINALRTSILEAYAGIFQGLQAQVHTLKPYVEHIILFTQHIFSFPVEDRDDGVVSAACGVLGDMAQRIQEAAPFLAQNEKVKAGLMEAKNSDNEDLKKEAAWAVSCIERVAGKLA
mmetsp:Transcript_14784/g.31758  ORF Transcript_14784/g.31758 Transcript_14784/m.31758 type:complete len:862 (-) Transcript_14784:329-2914(-)